MLRLRGDSFPADVLGVFDFYQSLLSESRRGAKVMEEGVLNRTREYKSYLGRIAWISVLWTILDYCVIPFAIIGMAKLLGLGNANEGSDPISIPFLTISAIFSLSCLRTSCGTLYDFRAREPAYRGVLRVFDREVRRALVRLDSGRGRRDRDFNVALSAIKRAVSSQSGHRFAVCVRFAYRRFPIEF